MFIKYRFSLIINCMALFLLFINGDNTSVILLNLPDINDIIGSTQNHIQTQLITSDLIPNTKAVVTEIPKNDSNSGLSEFSMITMTTTITAVEEIVTTTTDLQNLNENNNYPEKCDERRKLLEQPKYNSNVKIQKCCPYGENLDDKDGIYCNTKVTQKTKFIINIVNVVLYEKCIEDTEKNILFEYKIGNPCNISYVYGSQHGDILYIIQNGSLLIVDEFRNQSYQIENDYCLDVDINTGDLYAIVCINSIYAHISKGQTIIFTIFMICSIPCLIIVSYLHFIIKELRTLHGLSLGFLSLNLAIGFFLHSIAQLTHKNDEDNEMKFGHTIQYFILGYFVWLFILCLNVTITIWIFIPRYMVLPKAIRYARFGFYFCLATIIPLMFVFITKYKGFNGMPSYFYQAWSESVQLSQRYFIPPVTTLLILSVIFLSTTYFGFKRIEKIIETQSIDFEMYRETRKDFKCITYLTIIIVTTWLFEVITFYLPGIGDYLVMMEIFNDLQGVFILMIFIFIRDRRNLIIRWWYDRGSLNIEMEMKNLNSNNN